MSALEKNHMWDLTTLPKGKCTVGCKWVFTLKYGTISRYKAKVVAKGFTQSYVVDYFETFSPIAKLTFVRVLLSLAGNFNWPLYKLDVKNGFLYGD